MLKCIKLTCNLCTGLFFSQTKDTVEVINSLVNSSTIDLSFKNDQLIMNQDETSLNFWEKKHEKNGQKKNIKAKKKEKRTG